MKFSIRDLLLVTVIVALAVGWWVDRSRVSARLIKELEWRSSLEKREHINPEVNVYVERRPTSQAPAPNQPKK